MHDSPSPHRACVGSPPRARRTVRAAFGALAFLTASGCGSAHPAADSPSLLAMGTQPLPDFGLTAPRPPGATQVGLGSMVLCVTRPATVTLTGVTATSHSDGGDIVAAGIRSGTTRMESLVSGNPLRRLGYAPFPTTISVVCNDGSAPNAAPLKELMVVARVTDATRIDGVDVHYTSGGAPGVLHIPFHAAFCASSLKTCPEPKA